MNVKFKVSIEQPAADQVTGADVLDTSLLYEDLRREYLAHRRIIDVDFRRMTPWLKGGDQLTHQIHPYPAKLLPQIAHFFCRASILQETSGMLLDPFCGSGTVALEASLAGIKPYVVDANPFALMLSRVKTTPYNVLELEDQLQGLRDRSASYRSAPKVEIINSHLWYSTERKFALERILRAIRELKNEAAKEFFLVCFSVLARRLSFADPKINVPVRQRLKEEFSSSVKNEIKARFQWLESVSPFNEFVKVCRSNIERVALANSEAPCRESIHELGDDARKLRYLKNGSEETLPKASVGLVITSPPYGSAQKYVRASSLTLNWLELARPSELAMLERRSIGREHLSSKEPLCLESIPLKYQKQLKRISQVNFQRAKLTATYFREMIEVVRELSRVTLKGGRNVIVIGNNQVCGEIVENDSFLQNCFEVNGFAVEMVLRDDIRARGLMTARNRSVPAISHETVLVFRKV